MKVKVYEFCLQPTRSFPDGAPQREEYESDLQLEAAELRYAAEWRDEYECRGCGDPNCPQCSLPQERKKTGRRDRRSGRG